MKTYLRKAIEKMDKAHGYYIIIGILCFTMQTTAGYWFAAGMFGAWLLTLFGLALILKHWEAPPKPSPLKKFTIKKQNRENVPQKSGS